MELICARGFALRVSLLVLVAAFTLSDVSADNLTNLLATSPQLLSQGTPGDVLNNLEFDYGDNGRELNNELAETGGTAQGWTINATFTPTSADLATGQTRLIMEIGGTTNGTGLWLINGVPTLAMKTNLAGGAAAQAVATSLVANDLDLSDNAAAIYSSFGALTANNEVTVAVGWNGSNGFTMAVQDHVIQRGVVQMAEVTGTSNVYNWYGNGTFTEGDLPTAVASNKVNYGGLTETTGSPFTNTTAARFEGSFNGPDTLFWNTAANITITDPAKAVPTVTINRATGNVTLSNPTASALVLNGYTLIGGRSGFVSGGAWNSLATVDAGDGWSTTDPTGVQKDLGETTATGSFSIAAGGTYNFGNIWSRSPFSDVGVQLTTVGGAAINTLVQYTGTAIKLGDYNLNGLVDAGDWPTVLAGLISDQRANDGIVEYLAGDLTFDGQVNRADFRLFKQLYDADNGAGSFVQMLNAVPEPSTVALAGLLLATCVLGARRRGTAVVVGLALTAIVPHVAQASDIYFVNNVGEIRSFTGINAGANPLNGKNFGGGTLVGTVAGYGSYQDFTMIPDGRILGVDNTGSVVQWSNLAAWTGNTAPTVLSTGVYGAEVTTSPRSGIHGASFNGATGNLYVVYEGPDAREGDLGVYSTLPNFVGNLSPAITASAYNGNLLNFYYPGEDAPANTTINPGAAAGSNVFHITGTHHLEGWLDLTTPGFGYVAGGATGGGGGTGGNRSYEQLNFSNATNPVVAAFAVVTPTTEMTLVVDTRTGMVSIKRGADARDIDYLQVNSPAGGLVAGAYTGLAGNAGFPDGNGGGNGWDTFASNATSTNVQGEGYAFGSSNISSGASLIPLGAFYNTTLNTQDLVLSFDIAATGATTTVGGLYVEYFASEGLIGDYNNDNIVNAADYTVWRDNLGGDAAALGGNRDPLNTGVVSAADYDSWRAHFGQTLGGGALATGAQVPEPSAGWAFAAGLGALLARRVRASVK